MDSALRNRLRHHFIAPKSGDTADSVFLTDVAAPDESGRRADAVHIGLRHTRGFGEIDVCELKASREDWLRTLDESVEAEGWWPYCSRFWIVAPSIEVVHPAEVPDLWGLMVPKTSGRRFEVVRKPLVRKPDLTVGLLVTLLKTTARQEGPLALLQQTA